MMQRKYIEKDKKILAKNSNAMFLEYNKDKGQKLLLFSLKTKIKKITRMLMK